MQNNTAIPYDRLMDFYPDAFMRLLGHEESLRPYLGCDPFNFKSFIDYVRAARPVRLDRSVVRDIMEYNSNVRGNHGTAEYDKLLSGAYVVVTGQQPHIYGGPMYMLYKIATALSVRDFIEQYTKCPAVCIFWNHSDDDKLANFTQLTLLNSKKEPVQIRLEKSLEDTPAYLYSDITALTLFNSSLWSVISPDENFKDMIKETIKANLSVFFSKLLDVLFPDDRIVFVEPRAFSDGVLSPFYEKVFTSPKLVMDSFNDCVDELDNLGLKTGLQKTTSPGLYLIDGKKKKKIHFNNNAFTCDNEIIPGELQKITSYFRRVTCSYFLRPVLQDYLLGTCVYVSGPNELTYHLALRYLYEFFGVRRPFIYPRASATVLPEPVDMSIIPYFPALIYTQSGDVSELRLAMELKNISAVSNQITKKGLLVSEIASLNKHVARLSQRLADKTDLKALKDIVFPFGTLQERNLSYVATFHNNLGALKVIRSLLNCFLFHHQVIS